MKQNTKNKQLVIFQDKSIPDPEQELDIDGLGLRLDSVFMTLSRVLESLTESFASLNSTSLCSSASYRDSNSLSDDDQFEVSSSRRFHWT